MSKFPRDPSQRDATAESLELLVARCLERMDAHGDDALVEICEENPEFATELRRRVDRLRGLGLVGPSSQEQVSLPRMLGDYRLVRRLGGGGMGEVYVAEQAALGRVVALKVVRPELLAIPAVRRRFETEVETAARISHPGVVSIYAVGEAQGTPFFTMEYVRGCTLAEVLAEVEDRDPHDLTGLDLAHALHRAMGEDAQEAGTPDHELFNGSWVSACLGLARLVALALDHVHQLGVLHKDVKPSNILITPDGRALLIDFGLAAVQGVPRETHIDHAPGSLPYMSPEQLVGNPGELDPRTDVYSLGVTLAQLLTLTLPFPLKGSSYEVMQAILEGRRVTLRKRNRLLSRNAETVCRVAMSRERGARYASASDLARDLGNVLAHRPIQAKRSLPWVDFQLWVRRRPGWAAAALLLLLGLVTIVALDRRRDVSDEGLRLAYAANDLVEENPGLALLLAIEAHSREPGVQVRSTLYRSLDLLRERRTISVESAKSRIAAQRTGMLVATEEEAARINLYSLPDLHLVRSLVTGTETGLLRFDETGRLLLAGLIDGRALLWDSQTGSLVSEIRHDAGIVAGEFDAGGTRVLLLDESGAAKLWSTETGELITSLPHAEKDVGGAEAVKIDLHPGGRRAVVASPGRISSWKGEPGVGGEWAEFPFIGRPSSCEYAPDGERILVASVRGGIRLFDPDSAEPALSIQLGGPLGKSSFILGGTRVLGIVPGSLIQWDARTGARLSTVPIDQADLGFALSEDGLVAVVLKNRTTAVLDLKSGAEVASLRGHRYSPQVVFAGPAGHIVTSAYDRTLRVWQMNSVIPTVPLEAPAGNLTSARLSPQGDHLVTFTGSQAWVLDSRSGEHLHTLEHGSDVLKATFGPAGKMIALAGRDGTASVWTTDTGERRGVLSGHSAQLWYAAFSPDARSVATASSDGTCAVFDLASGQLTHRFAPGGEVGTVSFSPDGRRIVTGNTEHLVRVYDLNTDRQPLILRGHTGLIYRAEFSPGGDKIASCSADGTVRLWDADTGELLAVLEENMGGVTCVEFHPNGDYLVTVTASGTVTVWSLDTYALHAKLGSSFSAPIYASFSKDCTRILTVDNRPEIRSWPFDIYSAALNHKPRELAPEERRAWFD